MTYEILKYVNQFAADYSTKRMYVLVHSAKNFSYAFFPAKKKKKEKLKNFD